LIGYRLTWVKLEDALKQNSGLVAVVPVGSFEQHGHHLPFATDSMVAFRIAEMVEGRLPHKTVLFPPIIYGCSSEHRGFPGTVWVDYKVFIDYVCCVVDSLFEAGFKRVAAINAHGGNVQALSVAQRTLNLRLDRDNKLYVFNLTEFRDSTAKVFGRATGLQHAGYSETSMIEHICPDCVDHESLRKMSPDDFRTTSRDVFSVLRTREVSRTGMVDDWEPFETGDAAKGAKLLQEIAERIADSISQL
jgi:creatinine amidohydrolase